MIDRFTADQEDALRECLTGKSARFEQWSEHPPSEEFLIGFGVLSNAALAELAQHCFGAEWTHADVVRFVARSRTAYSLEPDEMDPRTAEQLLLQALGHIPGPFAQTDETHGRALGSLVPMLAYEARMDRSELDLFMGRVRLRAERQINRRGTR